MRQRRTTQITGQGMIVGQADVGHGLCPWHRPGFFAGGFFQKTRRQANHNLAAPRTPDESPQRAGTIRASHTSENTNARIVCGNRS